tara:strand:- start:454 stop:2307 length:1854 start_codon:yes stop_codon:yes gene_type:complete
MKYTTLILISFLSLSLFSQTQKELSYDFLDNEMNVVNLKNPKKISKNEQRLIFNFREYYVQGNKIIGEIKNYYASGKYPTINDNGGEEESSSWNRINFDRPEDRTGKLRSSYMPCENSLDSNCINGTLKKYYVNGQLTQESEWFNGTMKDGKKRVVYWPNGKIQQELQIVNGKPNGDFIFYYYDGESYIESTYVDGIVSGESRTTYANGDTVLGSYKNANQHGEWVRKNSEGITIFIGQYNNGELTSTKTFVNGEEVFDFNQPVTLSRARQYYDSRENLSQLEGLYKVNGSQVYNPGTNNQWSPNWDIALFVGSDGQSIFGYQTSCYCLSTSKVKNGEVRLKLEPTTVENFYNLIWVADNKNQQSELVEVKANGGLLTFNNHTMIKTYPTSKNRISKKPTSKIKSNEWAGNGSGIILTADGYIATNYHVIEDASDIEVEFLYKNEIKSFRAKVIQTDTTNDLAIIKIEDSNYRNLSSIPYNFKTRNADVGEEVFALGYPMALSIMGKEIKFTDGRISSKSGFQGDITTYQSTTPIQGGNSGGPLFDYKGNLIAINSAKLKSEFADNVSYSIKSSYLLSLIDALPQTIKIPNSTILYNQSLPQKIKTLSKYVVLIKVR